MNIKQLPEIIFFEERSGSNGIHCLDYKNDSSIKYYRDDVVRKISKANKFYESSLDQIKEENEKLKKGIEDFIDWMSEHRPKIAGLGAPILMLKDVLAGGEIPSRIDQIKSIINDESHTPEWKVQEVGKIVNG